MIKKYFFVFFKNNRTKNECFYKWVCFLNEHTIVSFVLIAKTQLNVDLLRYIHYNSYVFNNETKLGIEFYVGDEVIKVSEDDLNEYLHLPRFNFDEIPDVANFLSFFREVRATLEDGEIPRYF